jgi:hypothetical protein
MDQYVASLSEKATDMEIENSAFSTDATMTHDDSTRMDTTPAPPSGSSLAKAASIGSGGNKSTLPSTQMSVDESPLQTQDDFIAVPMSPKRATAIEDDEATNVSIPASPKTPASSPKKTPASSPKKTPVSSPKKPPASSQNICSSYCFCGSASEDTYYKSSPCWAPKDFYELRIPQQKCILGLRQSCLVSTLKRRG